jgi:hypothetical protein
MFEISETWLIDSIFSQLQRDKSLLGREVELFKYLEEYKGKALFFVLLFDNLMKICVSIRKVDIFSIPFTVDSFFAVPRHSLYQRLSSLILITQKSIFYVTMILYDNNTPTLFNKTLLVFIFYRYSKHLCQQRNRQKFAENISFEWRKRENVIT